MKGISFQQFNDVQVLACVSENNAGLGLHPGSGSQRPVVRNCIARRNGEDGLFLCWRVRHGLFEGNGGVILVQNTIRNQRTGIRLGPRAGTVTIERNQIIAERAIDDRRSAKEGRE